PVSEVRQQDDDERGEQAQAFERGHNCLTHSPCGMLSMSNTNSTKPSSSTDVSPSLIISTPTARSECRAPSDTSARRMYAPANSGTSRPDTSLRHPLCTPRLPPTLLSAVVVSGSATALPYPPRPAATRCCQSNFPT